MSISELKVGRRVQLSDLRNATIRFAGTTEFAPGVWVGIELDDATGKNDGSVLGERYFDCAMGYGMFVRPMMLKLLADPPAPFLPQQPPKSKPARPNSMVSTASRSSTSADPGLARRASLNAPSPTPPRNLSRTASGIKSPTKSPTKQPGTASHSGPPTRTTTPAPAKAPPGARQRPSVTANRPYLVTRRASAASTTAPAPGNAVPKVTSANAGRSASTAATFTSGTIPARTASGRVTTARQGVTRPASSRHASSGSQSSTDKQVRIDDRRSSSSSARSKGSDGEADNAATKNTTRSANATMPLKSILKRSDGETGSANTKDTTKTTNTARPPAAARVPSAAAATLRPAANTMAANKEIEDLKAKLRVLEKKRMEDREKLNVLEQTKSERDRFERIIQTLQIKYQPQQQELAELKRQLKEAEARFLSIEEMQQEHDAAMEIATLDREMAEEMADLYKGEVEALKHKSEELQLELEVLREENAELTKGMSSEDRASTGWLQMERNNERLREALIRLRDISREQEEIFKDQIKGLEEDLCDFEAAKHQLTACKEELAVKDAAVEDLREQLDNALGAEAIIESLTEQNMSNSEELKELRSVLRDLEALKEVTDELEANFIQNEKELLDEIDKRGAVIGEQARQLAAQKAATEELEYTVSRYRELVTSLQSDLADMRASHAVTEKESEQLTSRSRAMMDLNMKLHISAAKAQAKTIDLELRRMEAQEAEQHLAIVTMFLPTTYQADRDSVLALLRFKRLAVKADILGNHIRERVNGKTYPGDEDELFEGCAAIDKLTWVSCMCSRFIESISHASLDQFARYQGALHELEPVERALNGWIECLKRDDLKVSQCSADLQRTIALMTHLAEVHISSDLESFANDVHMKAVLMQSHLESSAVTFGAMATMVQRLAVDERGELSQIFANKTEDVITRTRSAKVIAGRTIRALEDLKTRSLSPQPDTLDAFEQCQTAAAQLAEMARDIGLRLYGILNLGGGGEPYTFTEVVACIQSIPEEVVDEDAASDLFDDYLRKLHTTTAQLSDLAAVSTDLTRTREFERSPAPWVLRTQALKAADKVPAEAEAEARRLREELAGARRTLAMRDEDLSTAQLKIETLESRMRDAKAKASRISELETNLDATKKRIGVLTETLEKQDRELKSLEEYRAKWEAVSSRETKADGVSDEWLGRKVPQEVINNDRALAKKDRDVDQIYRDITDLLARERLRSKQVALQSKSFWLEEPLAKPEPPTEERKTKVNAEGRAVLGSLVNLASDASVFDMATLPADKAAWKPAKSTPQYRAAKDMENYGGWEGWHGVTVDRGMAAKGRVPTRVSSMPSGRKTSSWIADLRVRRLKKTEPAAPLQPQFVGSDEWEALQGRRCW